VLVFRKDHAHSKTESVIATAWSAAASASACAINATTAAVLTPKGRALQNTLLPHAISTNAIAGKGVSAKDLAQLRRIVKVVRGNLEFFSSGKRQRARAIRPSQGEFLSLLN